jgi:cytochrome c-type biogenesis protein CcmH
MGALGRFDEAAAAYEHLAKLVPDDAQVLADYADALGMAQGRTLAGRPTELVKKALAIDPRNRKALALAGTAAMDTGDFEASARYWQLLAAQTAPDSDDAKQVQAILDEVKDKAAAAGKPLPPSATRVVVAAPAAPSGALTGSVSIAPDLEKKIAASDTLFVFARAENGSRMPLAVVRSSAKSLPMTFALDDSMAMSPNARLSGASAVRVEARVSRSGTATPQSGDFIGTSEVVKPNARDVKIVIDKTVP